MPYRNIILFSVVRKKKRTSDEQSFIEILEDSESKDVNAIIHSFADVMIEGIDDGRIVDKGVLGAICLKITAKAVDTKEKCTVDIIKPRASSTAPTLNFRTRPRR